MTHYLSRRACSFSDNSFLVDPYFLGQPDLSIPTFILGGFPDSGSVPIANFIVLAEQGIKVAIIVYLVVVDSKFICHA